MKHFTLALGLFGMLAAGCSADVESVFGKPANTGGSPSSDGGAGEGGAPSSDGGSTNTSPPTTSNVEPTTTTTTTTTTNETVTSTATGMPPQVSVDCNGSQCVVESGGACCFNLDAETSVCQPSGNCGDDITTTIVTVQCQTADDCSGQICCAHRELPSGSSPYDSTSCVSECNYPDLYLCDINAPDCPVYETPNGPVQSECKQSTLLPSGYYVCGFNN
jgi:hypothetical protein